MALGRKTGGRKPSNATHCVDCNEDLNINPLYRQGYRLTRCRVCTNERYKERNKEVNRVYCLKRNFGITLEDYTRLLAFQGGVCAICKQESTDKNLSVDHNHATGEIRGLLCQKCNQAIGLLNEDYKIFMNAYEYLDRTTWTRGLELVRKGSKI